MNPASQAAAGNRFERRRERTRQDLLAAATRVLAEKGLHRTKIADIAAAADVGVGTFYLHFPDKDSLRQCVAAWGWPISSTKVILKRHGSRSAALPAWLRNIPACWAVNACSLAPWRE